MEPIDTNIQSEDIQYEEDDDHDTRLLIQKRKKGTDHEHDKSIVPTEGKGNKWINIVISVVTTIAAVITSLLVGAWSRIAFEERQAVITFIILIVIASVGIIASLFLFTQICNLSDSESQNEDAKSNSSGTSVRSTVENFKTLKNIFSLKYQRIDKSSSIWKIKHGFLFTFAVGYLTHCGWYAVRSVNCSEGEEVVLGLIFNIISSVFTFLQLFYFVIHKNVKFIFRNWAKLPAFFVILQNACIWLDALLSESAEMFAKNETFKDHNRSNCSNTDVENFIKETDTFLNPMMIEYSLLAIQMLFSIMKDRPQQTEEMMRQSIGINNGERKDKGEISWSIIISLLSLLIFCYTAAFFMFSLYVTLGGKDDFMKNFTIYISFQLTSKTCLLIFISIIVVNIVSIERTKIKTHPMDIGKVCLLLSGFLNVFNCMFNMYPVLGLNNLGEKLSFSQSIICIALECIQNILLFIVPYTYSRIMQCLYPQLAILNFGLWACGSIGEVRVHTFTEIQYHYYKKNVWMINTKILLPATIFYRFHCAMEFLELWVESSKLPEDDTNEAKQSQEETIPKKTS